MIKVLTLIVLLFAVAFQGTRAEEAKIPSEKLLREGGRQKRLLCEYIISTDSGSINNIYYRINIISKNIINNDYLLFCNLKFVNKGNFKSTH